MRLNWLSLRHSTWPHSDFKVCLTSCSNGSIACLVFKVSALLLSVPCMWLSVVILGLSCSLFHHSGSKALLCFCGCFPHMHSLEACFLHWFIYKTRESLSFSLFSLCFSQFSPNPRASYSLVNFCFCTFPHSKCSPGGKWWENRKGKIIGIPHFLDHSLPLTPPEWQNVLFLGVQGAYTNVAAAFPAASKLLKWHWLEGRATGQKGEITQKCVHTCWLAREAFPSHSRKSGFL